MESQGDVKRRAESLERYADYLDTKFRIPGTDIRFGLDFLIGLIPGLGDVISFGLSGGLVMMMIAKGASGKALALMFVNIFLDVTLGSVPVVGDIFDLFFKANKRNLDLFQDHFEEGKYKGSAWVIIIPILIFLFVLLIGLFYLAMKLASALWVFIIS